MAAMMWVRVGIAGAAFLAPLNVLHAQSNNHSQVINLPDPTPRPKDPDLVYGNNRDKQSRVDSKAVQRITAKRRQLVEWAANEIVALSARVEVELSGPVTDASLAAAQQDTSKIIKLAGSLSDAVKAQ